MYVCVCNAVTDSQIREAAQSGARTLRELRQQLGIMGDCGRCASCAYECLRAANGNSKPCQAARKSKI